MSHSVLLDVGKAENNLLICSGEVGLTMQENWLMESFLPKLALLSLHSWTGLQAGRPSDFQTRSTAATTARWSGRLSPPLASQFAKISPHSFSVQSVTVLVL